MGKVKEVDHVEEMFKDGKSIMLPDGSERPDPRPMELPVGFERPESIQDLIKRLVTDQRIREELETSDVESFEEADDFDVEDDVPVNSPYEENFDPMGVISRDQEIRGGVVKPLSKEELAASKAILEQHAARPKAAVDDAPAKKPEAAA